MIHLHCFDCDRTVDFIGMSPLGAVVIGHATGCKGMRVTPIAVICDPPEPTVIDESDLAPGMVVVAVEVMEEVKAAAASRRPSAIH